MSPAAWLSSWSLGHIERMHILPRTREEWTRSALFPFKAYTIIALPCELIFDPHFFIWRFGHMGDVTDLVFAGYLLVGVILVLAGLIQKYLIKSQTTTSTFTFGFVALFIGFVVIPSLTTA
jgi:hypothetical protein